MSKAIATEQLEKDILSGHSKYLKDGYVKFNSISMEQKEEKIIVTFIAEDKVPLFTMTSTYTPGDMLHIEMTDGYMRMEIN